MARGTTRLAEPRELWDAFVDAGETVAHDERVRQHYGDRDAWSVILPVHDSAVIERAARVRADLGIDGLRWYTPDEFHVTLLMARIDPGDAWIARAREAAASMPAPGASVGGAGAFPQGLFLEVEAAADIANGRARLTALAGGEAFDHRDEPWLPHITIAAFEQGGIPTADVAASLEPLRSLPPIDVAFGELTVSHIRFDADGRVHTLEEHRIPFAGGTHQ